MGDVIAVEMPGSAMFWGWVFVSKGFLPILDYEPIRKGVDLHYRVTVPKGRSRRITDFVVEESAIRWRH